MENETEALCSLKKTVDICGSSYVLACCMYLAEFFFFFRVSTDSIAWAKAYCIGVHILACKWQDKKNKCAFIYSAVKKEKKRWMKLLLELWGSICYRLLFFYYLLFFDFCKNIFFIIFLIHQLDALEHL